jgi:hypothetical protein
VKAIDNPVIPGPRSGTRNPEISKRQRWIPAFAGMTIHFISAFQDD